MSLEAWAAAVDGVSLDMDYAFPQECHDVFLSWLSTLGGSISDGHAPGVGYTNAVWYGFPTHRPGLARFFTKHGPETILAGDVVFWDSYAGVGGLPHVAVALADAGPHSVYCMTQNPGVTHRETLTRAGVVGVLRPIKQEDIVTEEQMKRLLAAIADVPRATLDTRVKRTGIDKFGKKRTGTLSLRQLVGSWEHQIGLTRRLVERIVKKLKA